MKTIKCHVVISPLYNPFLLNLDNITNIYISYIFISNILLYIANGKIFTMSIDFKNLTYFFLS